MQTFVLKTVELLRSRGSWGWCVGMFAVVGLLWSGLTSAATRAGQLHGVEVIREGFVRNRLEIHRWHISRIYKIEYCDPEFAGLGDDVEMVRSVTYCDGKLQRLDQTFVYRPEERFTGLAEDVYEDFIVWGEKDRIHWSTKKLKESVIACVLHDRESELSQSLEPDALLMDCRWDGWLPDSDFGFHPNEMFLSPQFQWEIRDDQWQGTRCRVLEYNRKKEPTDHGEFWFSPDQGFAVLRSTYEDPEVQIEAVFDVQEWKDSGIWYPRRAEREFRDADGTVTKRDVTEYEVHSINEDLDPDLFTLAALPLPAGTPVRYRPLRGDGRTEFVWDGEKVVEQVPATPEEKKLRTSGRLRWALLMNGFFVTLIGVWLVLRALRRTA